MDFTKMDGPYLSDAEVALLALLLLLCLAVLGAMYWKWSGGARSDVSGLRLNRRARERRSP